MKKKLDTKIFYRGDINDSISTLKCELKQKLMSMLSGRSVFTYSGKICNANILDFHRILSEWKCKSNVNYCLKNILVSAFYSIEVKYPGSGFVAALMWTNIIDSNHDQHRSKTQDVYSCIDSLCQGSLSSDIVKTIYHMGLAGSQLTLNEANHFGTSIKIVDGSAISGNIDNIFCHDGKQFKIVDDAFIVSIEGIVENISQIHNILEQSKGHAVIICALGFFPDVSHTLRENFDKNLLKVFPFVTKTFNRSLIELAQSGIECLTSDMGSSISNITLNKKLRVVLTNDEFLYTEQNTSNFNRHIEVSFGTDLSSLRGIAIDRTKILSSIVRSIIKTGFISFTLCNKEIIMPYGSLCAANKCLISLETTLNQVGAILYQNLKKEK